MTKDLNYPWKEMVLHGVEEQADYSFPSDYVRLHPMLDAFFRKKKMDKFTAKWLESQYPEYQSATGVEYPECFYTRFFNKVSIYPPPKLIASGSATAGSGTTTLIDSSASFISGYVGHSIRNITDGSNALITAVTSSTQLTASLSGGTNNVWTAGNTYKIHGAGTVTYTYKEALMALDSDENEMAKVFPFLIIYRVMPVAEIKAFRTDPASQQQARVGIWDGRYSNELARAMAQVNRNIRGMRRTMSPFEIV